MRYLLQNMKRNIAFWVFMYALGIVTAFVVLPQTRNAKIYDHLFTELFVDVTVLFLFLSLLPQKISVWIKRLFYIIAYIVAIVDVYCFIKFGSTLTPTMLLLVGETNAQEAGEFLKSYLSTDIIFSKLGWVLLVMLVHVIWSVIRIKRQEARSKRNVLSKCHDKHKGILLLLASCLLFLTFLFSLTDCWKNKEAFHRLMSYQTIGEVEHELTEKTCANLYQPLYRLAFSIRANQLTAQQVQKLITGIDKVQVDSCAFTTPHIILIIGESYNRHHAQLYGYEKPTTPRQLKRAQQGELIAYQDVVAPWNLTSFVFKYLFSLYTVGDQGEWCDYPLFPEVFRQAGYHVTFLTNQFLPQAKEAVYDFSGGFFLNNPTLSNAMFDARNEKLSYYDEGLLKDWDDIRGVRNVESGVTKAGAGKASSKQGELTIVHLKGQHLDYRTRSPKTRWFFKRDDYDRPDLSPAEIQRLAYYDNAILYNDSIVDQVIRRVENEQAVVIYVPDHGEECYGPGVHFCGRMHSTEITGRLAHEEFDIPFWIWCSHTFMVEQPELFDAIVRAKNRRYMTDAIPFLLMHLAGIHTPDYREELDILSPQYNEMRPRILKNTTDYDKIKDQR